MKPLVVFDLETTGLDKSKDQIIQFAAVKVQDDEIIDKLNLYIQPTGNYTIGIAAYFKHHIKPEFLADKPHIYEVAPQIIKFFEGCDILTYNGNRFDIAFLKTELNKYAFDIDFTQYNCYDAWVEEQRRNNTSLVNTFKRYYNKSMEDAGLEAHNAFSDVQATYEVFKVQQKIKEYGPENMYGEDGVIVDMEFQDEIKPCFNLGKYRQLSVEFVATIDQSYLQWAVSDKCSFLPSTKEFIKKYIK